MLCARVMRGISSTENEVTPAAAISCKVRTSPTERTQESDEHLPAPHQGNVGAAGAIVRSVAQHLHDDVGGGKHIAAARGESSRPFRRRAASG